MDDSLDAHRRRAACARVRLVAGALRRRALTGAWQTWRLTTQAQALMLLQAPGGTGGGGGRIRIGVTQDDEHHQQQGFSASGNSMSMPSLHAGMATSAGAISASTPMAGSSTSNAHAHASSRPPMHGSASKTRAAAVFPNGDDDLIPQAVLHAASSPAPLARGAGGKLSIGGGGSNSGSVASGLGKTAAAGGSGSGGQVIAQSASASALQASLNSLSSMLSAGPTGTQPQ